MPGELLLAAASAGVHCGNPDCARQEPSRRSRRCCQGRPRRSEPTSQSAAFFSSSSARTAARIFFRQIRRRRVRERDRRLGGQLQRLVQQADLDVGSADVNADLIHMQCLFSFQTHPWTLRVSGHFLLKIIRRSSQKARSAAIIFFSGSRVRASPSYPQEEVAPAIFEDAVLFHPSKLQRQAAALDAKIIRKLLS